MSLVVALAAVAFIFWGAVYFTFFQADGSPVADLLWGARVPLPQEPGVWVTTPCAEEGLLREERILLENGLLSQIVVHQVRYRSRAHGAIEQVQPEVRTRRLRSRSAARGG